MNRRQLAPVMMLKPFCLPAMPRSGIGMLNMHIIWKVAIADHVIERLSLFHHSSQCGVINSRCQFDICLGIMWLWKQKTWQVRIPLGMLAKILISEEMSQLFLQWYVSGLTVTFLIAAVSQDISRLKAENCTGFPQPLRQSASLMWNCIH